MHEVLVNRLGGLSLPRKSVVRLNDRPDMTSDVYRGRKTAIQLQYNSFNSYTLCNHVTYFDFLKTLQLEDIEAKASDLKCA